MSQPIRLETTRKSWKLGDYESQEPSSEAHHAPSHYQDIGLELCHFPPHETSHFDENHHRIGINLGQSFEYKYIFQQQQQQGVMLRGSINILPAQIPIQLEWKSQAQLLFLNLSKDLLTRNALELWGAPEVELIPAFAIQDPLIYRIGTTLKEALEFSQSDCTVYLRTLANALAVHLLLNFSIHQPKEPKEVGVLSADNLKRVIHYVEENIGQKLSLDELATIAHLSQYHFARSFKQSTGLSPYQYVIQKRVEHAKRLLSSSQMTVSEVAMACGFNHQSHLGRHFKRLVGITPKEFINS